MRVGIFGILLSTLAIVPQTLRAQSVEADFPTGFLARYTAGDKTVQRIDPAVAFDWGTASPDPRLPKGRFSAEWQGTLLVRTAGTHQLHAYGQGEIQVVLDGQTVLSGKRKQPGWIGGKPFSLNFGDQPIHIEFRKTAPEARVQLFWSSDSFRLEPLPTLSVFREESRPELRKRELGRILFSASRCNRCHQRDNENPAPDAPALNRLKTGTDGNWLVKKLEQPHGPPSARMPDFGFSRKQAEQIAAYLMQSGEEAKLSTFKTKDREKDARRGQILFRSTGCLSCHTNGKQGQSGPFGGGDLSQIGEKRSEDWLYTWLKSPGALNADHRMPIVKLSQVERRQLAVFLSGLRPSREEKESKAELSQDEILAGKRLIQKARCASCHRLESEKTDAIEPNRKLPELSQPVKAWTKSCLAEKPDTKTFRPAYSQLDPAEREAIQIYVNSRRGKLSAAGEFHRGRLVLEQNNCLSCHERNRAQGVVEVAGAMARIDSALQGQSQALIPPALNAVGDKLQNSALAEAVSGEQEKPRLPWLKVRMPQFDHAKNEKAALVHYLVSQDRVPENAPIKHAPELSADKEKILVAGHTLIGPKGFSCVACHRVGSFAPRNVALGTRGSDLIGLGKRMRKSYYLRWTQSPQRIVPGMEMPAIRKAVPGMLGEDIPTQLAATWDALNDPDFTAPTDPSSVEQLLVTRPGEPARIVRDVFTNPKDNGGGYVARSLAIGLNNGHNLVLDLDNFTLRNWTFGDFARQRTEGKSWYWDLAGVPVMEGFTEKSDIVLKNKSQAGDSLLWPHKENNSRGRLLAYRSLPDGSVELAYRLHFQPAGQDRFSIHVEESIEPRPGGWERRLRFQGVPAGYQVAVSTNRRSPLLGKPKVSVAGKIDGAMPEFAPAKNGNVTIRYSSNLERPELELPPKPDVNSPIQDVTSLPGYTGKRLPLPGSIMPTALAWADRELPGIPKGTLVFTSLKGHLFVAQDTDGDGLEDSLTKFEEGLAAPYGVLPYKRGFLVAHKPEVIYLEDADGDGRADVRKVVATGWGYSDNYHDWTTSLIRDSQGRFYVGLGSDYAQPRRSEETSRWRGDVIQITPTPEPQEGMETFEPWKIEPVGHAFRYPTGLAINEDDEIFVTDNQGVQNTFNEINHLVKGRHYGVPSRFGRKPKEGENPDTSPAIQVPHPWTRSVNGVFFLPRSGPGHSEFRGHGIGCEYDTRFLIRFSLQKVAGEFQGAAYYFSRPNAGAGGENFQGPLSGGVSPEGNIYIGSIHDSGWLGGQNTGAIVKLTPKNDLPGNGIREVRATPEGFDVEFLKPVGKKAASNADNYAIAGYTRKWKGGYATPDSGRHKLDVQTASLQPDGRTVALKIENLREGHVYEIRCKDLADPKDEALFPAAAHYTLHRIPQSAN